MRLWRATPDWAGETCFIVGGGTSFAAVDVERLKGRRIIVVNSSYERVPFADYLVFCDPKWWRFADHRPKLKAIKTLRVVTVSMVAAMDDGPPLLNMRKHPGDRFKDVRLTDDRSALAMRRTTLTAAINLGVHFGCNRIVLLGADGKRAKDGRSHHHTLHPWPVKEGCWKQHAAELQGIVGCLNKRKVEVLNASPISTYDAFRKVSPEDVL
jgi:hypothetical protein